MFLLFRLCSILAVPIVWYCNCPGSVVYYLSPTIWNVLTVPTVWYFNCPRQCGMFLLSRQCDILTVPDNVECSYCSYIVVLYLFTTMGNVLTVPTVWYFNCHGQCGIFLLFLQCGILTARQCGIWTVPAVWYINCPRQYGMFLLFLQFGILTVQDNVECSYCSYSVVF